MTDTVTDTWSTQPCLGLLPHFHADPSAGVPLVSTDGHWWWDGYAWTPAPDLSLVREPETEQPAPAVAGAG